MPMVPHPPTYRRHAMTCRLRPVSTREVAQAALHVEVAMGEIAASADPARHADDLRRLRSMRAELRRRREERRAERLFEMRRRLREVRETQLHRAGELLKDAESREAAHVEQKAMCDANRDERLKSITQRADEGAQRCAEFQRQEAQKRFEKAEERADRREMRLKMNDLQRSEAVEALRARMLERARTAEERRLIHLDEIDLKHTRALDEYAAIVARREQQAKSAERRRREQPMASTRTEMDRGALIETHEERLKRHEHKVAAVEERMRLDAQLRDEERQLFGLRLRSRLQHHEKAHVEQLSGRVTAGERFADELKSRTASAEASKQRRLEALSARRQREYARDQQQHRLAHERYAAEQNRREEASVARRLQHIDLAVREALRGAGNSQHCTLPVIANADADSED